MTAKWKKVDENTPRDRNIIGGYFNQPWVESHRNGRIVKCWYEPQFGAFISSCHEYTLAKGYTFDDGTTRKLHSPEIEDISHWIEYPEEPEPEND